MLTARMSQLLSAIAANSSTKSKVLFGVGSLVTCKFGSWEVSRLRLFPPLCELGRVCQDEHDVDELKCCMLGRFDKTPR